MKKLIYIIDDERDIQDILKINLEKEGYNVKTFSSANDFLRETSGLPDLIILDIMMEGMNGYDLCRNLRSSEKYKTVPIIFLSAKSEEFDKVLGLELGGDDYVVKPFSVKELLSRVKAVLRRSSTPVEEKNKIIYYKGIELNPDMYSVRIDDREVKFTKTEFELLHLFLRHPGKIYTRDNIIDSIRGMDVYIADRTIDVHVMNIRKKLGKYKECVSTFSGVGYGIKE